MSGSDRDRRGRPHSGKDCPESVNGGCSWCKTGEYKRPVRRRERHEVRQGLRTAGTGD